MTNTELINKAASVVKVRKTKGGLFVVLDKDKAVKLKELFPYYDWWQKID